MPDPTTVTQRTPICGTPIMKNSNSQKGKEEEEEKHQATVDSRQDQNLSVKLKMISPSALSSLAWPQPPPLGETSGSHPNAQ